MSIGAVCTMRVQYNLANIMELARLAGVFFTPVRRARVSHRPTKPVLDLEFRRDRSLF